MRSRGKLLSWGIYPPSPIAGDLCEFIQAPRAATADKDLAAAYPGSGFGKGGAPLPLQLHIIVPDDLLYAQGWKNDHIFFEL